MPPKILIADDSALLRAALRGLFSDIGDYEIMEAETGAEAMDGLSATRVLQKRLPEIPILMYTMHYTQQLCEVAQGAGVRKVISKSETNSLIAAIQEFLSSPPAAAKSAPATAITATVEDGAFGMPTAGTGT